MDFKDIIVKKPWGYEYLIYENDNVGLWKLHINPKQSTSLHTHPNKKTGLFVLQGTAQVSFLSDQRILNSKEKVMIRQGVFHSTSALDEELILLEIETPKDKEDLVRLKDNYGRQGKQYEGEENYNRNIKVETIEELSKYGVHLARTYGRKETLEILSFYENIIILSGDGIKFQDHTILGPGDIVNFNTIKKLASEFDVYGLECLGSLKKHE